MQSKKAISLGLIVALIVGFVLGNHFSIKKINCSEKPFQEYSLVSTKDYYKDIAYRHILKSAYVIQHDRTTGMPFGDLALGGDKITITVAKDEIDKLITTNPTRSMQMKYQKYIGIMQLCDVARSNLQYPWSGICITDKDLRLPDED